MNLVVRPTAVATAALICLVGGVQAQTLDQFEVRREGNNAVVQLKFSTEVQFKRSFSTRSGDLTLIFYTLLATTNAEIRATQSLRLGAAHGLPEITLSDEAEKEQRERKIVVRTADATRLKVRAGQGNRSIELVIEDAAASVGVAPPVRPTRPAPAPVIAAAPPAGAMPSAPAVAAASITPATLPDAERRFVIVLQSSSSPDARMPAMVPRSLQNYEVFTAQRQVAGKTQYEVQLGYFASRTQAEAVLPQLRAFPEAIIAALPSVEVPVTVAAAVAPTPAAAPVVVTPPPASVPAAPAAVTVPAPVPVPVPVPVPAPLPVPSLPPASPVAVPAATASVSGTATEPPPLSAAEVEAKAAGLLVTAKAAMAQLNFVDALQPLNELLNLPPNGSTRDAQEMAGLSRARSGDVARARIEFETYLQLYPQGEGSERVRRELAALPAAAPVVADTGRQRPEVETTVTGSASMYYYGGNGQVRSQEFKDSPIAGLPQVAGDPLFNSDKSRQLFNDVDLSWRRRDGEQDMRFVFRDSYTTDLDRSDKSKNRLSSLYFDYKSLTDGYGVRLGRQSPTGGGVMGRFDGVTANYLLRPKLKVSAVAGKPTDKFFDSKRRFYGASIDADALLPNFGAGLYVIQQSIDREIDRRALGLEMRYFKGGASVFSQFDYDALIKGLNIATVQGTLVMEDNTIFNALYDRRALTMLALGNSLTFEDPANPGVLFSRIEDKLATTTLQALREQIKGTTPYITQAQVGVTTPVSKSWQVGSSAQLTTTGAIPPVPEVVGFENGRAASGNIYTLSAQLIGLNLYSSRDTHVFSSSVISSPTLKGFLMSYNNSSIAWDVWQLEPSLQYYRDRNPEGSTNQRWTPGLRVTYRGFARWALESNLTYELGKGSRVSADPTDPTKTVTTKDSSTRVNYSLGARYEF